MAAAEGRKPASATGFPSLFFRVHRLSRELGVELSCIVVSRYSPAAGPLYTTPPSHPSRLSVTSSRTSLCSNWGACLKLCWLGLALFLLV